MSKCQPLEIVLPVFAGFSQKPKRKLEVAKDRCFAEVVAVDACFDLFSRAPPPKLRGIGAWDPASIGFIEAWGSPHLFPAVAKWRFHEGSWGQDLKIQLFQPCGFKLASLLHVVGHGAQSGAGQVTQFFSQVLIRGQELQFRV